MTCANCTAVNCQINSLINNLSQNQEFELSEIFGSDWDNIGVSPTICGKLFADAVQNGKYPTIIPLNKKSNNHSIYKKI